MKALLSFFTVLPMRGASLEQAARKVHLPPLVGVVTGCLAPCWSYPPTCATRCRGHPRARGSARRLRPAPRRRRSRRRRRADGRGEPERRREVLKTPASASAGSARSSSSTLPPWRRCRMCAHSPARAALALLCGEVAARSAMVLTLAYGKPADERSSTAPFVGTLGSAPRNRSCAGVC